MKEHAAYRRPGRFARRDRIQARVLVVLAGTILTAACAWRIQSFSTSGQNAVPFDLAARYHAAGFSLTFGLLAWVLRAATPAAALCGSMICLLLSCATGKSGDSLLHSGLTPLLALFVLTFLATRLGRSRKQALGLAEPAHGRNAAQVIANLGAAGMLAAIAGSPLLWLARPLLTPHATIPWNMLLVAALAEATADTLSSEIGQAFGGTPRTITRLRAVPPGTDGAISVLGTCAGLAAAAAIAATGAFALRLDAPSASIAFSAASAGLFFDSLLGATVEPRGWLGNDLVNFASTVFAVAFAWALWTLF